MERRSQEPVAEMIVLAVAGAALCGVTLWRDWSPVPWWIGAAVLAIALIVIAWRRAQRRTAWVAGAAVVGLAVAAVPVVEPMTRARAEVAWSLEGSEKPVVATDSLILTVDEDHMARARAADDGAVAWEREMPFFELGEDPPVDLVDDVVLLGARGLADDDDRMVALDVASGDELWTAPAAMAPLVYDGSILVAYAYDDELGDVHRGLDLGTGEVQWTNPGSRGAFESVPARVPGSGVRSAEWLADGDVATDGNAPGISYTVTRVSSGEQLVVDADPGAYRSVAGVVDEQLVVQQIRTDPREGDPGDAIPTTVTAYDLAGGGEVAWESDLDVDDEDWVSFDTSGRLNTVDGVRLVASADGANLDVLNLADGSLMQVPAPSGARFVGSTQGTLGRTHAVWVHELTALAPVNDSRWAVVDLDAGSAVLVADSLGYSVRASVQRDDRMVPVWEEEASTVFGREYDELTALDVSDSAEPGVVGLGMLPDGMVTGTYAGRVVLVDEEEIEGAKDGEPQTRVLGMHVLAPSEDDD